MDATSPLRSGQATRRMAEFFMGCRSPGARDAGKTLPAPSLRYCSSRRSSCAWVLSLLLQILQDLACGIGPRAARQARAGMRATSAQIQILNRRSVTRPIQQRPHGEKLVESQIAVEDLSASKAVGVFQVLRSDDLVRQNQLGQVGSVLRESLNHGLSQRLALSFPIAVQFVGCVLHVN